MPLKFQCVVSGAGAALLLLVLSPASTAETMFSEAIGERARQATQVLAGNLGSRLKRAMAGGGPLAALATCHVEAGPVTEATSKELGLVVARTGLRVRNPSNAPDSWEREQLAHFATRIAAGSDPATLEVLLPATAADTSSSWRYMRPIMTQGVCLQCHGDTLAPDVREALKVRYPQDEAIGFKLGELRGAFTVTLTQ